MATIKDVANRAGVSKSTISYYLNNTKNLTDETKNRIKTAIEELNYHPRIAARSLKTKRTLTIGVIVPDIGLSFFTDIINGIENIAFLHEFSIILCNTKEDESIEKKHLQTLISKDIDGLIFISTGQNQHILDNIKNIPIVVVDRKTGDGVSSVVVDNRKGGYIATKHLLEKRGAPVHLITGKLNISTYFDRLSGYIDAHRELGYEYNDALIYESAISIQGAIDTVGRLVDSNEPIKSIFATSDIVSLGVLKALTQRGYIVGKDILLVGFDDSIMDQIVTPSLTTIHQPKYEMGAKSAELLIKQIEAKMKLNETVVMAPHLVIRETA